MTRGKHSRRCACNEEFFVGPQIAKLNDLSPSDLNWALDRLEGQVVTTQSRLRGKFRRLRLLPHFESKVMECSGRNAASPSAIPKGHPDEERVYVDTDEVLARAGAAKCEPSDEILETLRELASEQTKP